MHYNHCVSPSVRQISFNTFLHLASDTEKLTFTTGRANLQSADLNLGQIYVIGQGQTHLKYGHISYKIRGNEK